MCETLLLANSYTDTLRPVRSRASARVLWAGTASRILIDSRSSSHTKTHHHCKVSDVDPLNDSARACTSDLSPGERYETELDALAAGAKLFADRNGRHWASQPEVVARIRTFIKESIPWHLSGMWEDNPREVVTCLSRWVLDGSVVILRVEPAYVAHSGFVPIRQYDDAAYEKDIAERASSYAARSKTHRDDLKAYNQAIDERDARTASALRPFRHIETIAEAGARNLAARAASGGFASSVGTVVSAVASSLPSFNEAAEDEGVLNLGDVTELHAGSTPLGDAAPFEYVKSATGDDVLSIAARGARRQRGARSGLFR
jgi:hypothetical protein